VIRPPERGRFGWPRYRFDDLVVTVGMGLVIRVEELLLTRTDAKAHEDVHTLRDHRDLRRATASPGSPSSASRSRIAAPPIATATGDRDGRSRPRRAIATATGDRDGDGGSQS
jgi:hypothetical protein